MNIFGYTVFHLSVFGTVNAYDVKLKNKVYI